MFVAVSTEIIACGADGNGNTHSNRCMATSSALGSFGIGGAQPIEPFSSLSGGRRVFGEVAAFAAAACSSNRGDLRRVVHACWLPKNWGSTVQALPGGISAFLPSVQAAEPNSRRFCVTAVSPDLVLAGEAEYERGYGSGPFGMREVKLSKGFTLNPVVSVFAAAVLWILVIKVSEEKEQSMKDFKAAQSWVTSTFTWFYISSQCYWVLYVVPLVYYYGDVKLGKDDEKPEYSDASYFAMVFCAGVGIGLIFYGASEPLWHMLSSGGSNRYNNNGYFNDNEKAQAAINVTLFHWGIQAWVGYAITAVSMGFLSYRKGLPLTFRVTLAPLFGKAIWGWFGDLVDILAIVTIVAGLCNFLLLTVFFLDAPWYLLNVMVQSLGYHIQNFIEISFVTDAFAQLAKGEGAPNDGLGADPAWMDWWTIFYWGWWISWAPFVGAFLARISRGRTIGNVFFYSLSVPFFYALVWFGTFGGASIRMHRRATFLSDMGLQLHQNADFYLHTSSDFRPAGAGKCYTVPESLNHASYSAAGAYVTDMKLSPVCAFSWADDSGYWFDLMGQYHGLGPFLCFVSLITIVLYFVTSSDSGSLIVDLIANNGRESHWVQRVFWALTEGAVATALLRAGGQESLKALQSVSICAGLPFTVILMLMCSALWRALKIDQQHMPARDQRVDWALPLYGGIFDLLEFVLSLGKSGLPQSSAVRDFFLGLFAPPLLLWKALRGLAALQAQQPKGSSEDSQPSTVLQDGFMVAACSLTFSSWIILHILTGAKMEGASGLWGIAWTAFVGFAVLVASVRHVVRAHFKIEGSGCEDFFAALLFWPQTLAQMVQQVSQEHSSKSVTSGEEQLKQVEKEGSSNRGDLRRVVHACRPPKNWGSTVQALPAGISAFLPSVQAAEPNSRRQCNSASRSSFLRDPAMAEASPDLVLAGEAEYERGYGSGPFGMREVKLSKGFTLNPVVSVFAAAVLWILVIKVSVEKEQSMKDFKEAQSWVTSTFTWFYISSQCYWVLYVVPLVYYYGDVKLGKDDEKPEYSDASYFAMVFCAGVGIGLIFYGASEPLWHMLSSGGSNRYNNNGYFNDNEKAQAAINVTLFHWGIQAWVGYAITAVSMGFLSYRKGLPLTFRVTLAPLFGKAIWGWFGDLVDILAIVTIVAGLCNFLLLTVFFLDAPWYLLNVMVQSLGYHIQNFIEISFVTDAFAQLAKGEGAPNDGLGADPAWMDWWTIFYWGWWISWAPFVGAFLARISRGRTIRNVFFYSLSVPFFYALVWFGTFGGASIRMHRRATFLSDMGLQLHQNADFYLHTSNDFRPAGAGKCYTVPESLNHASYSAAGAYVTDMKVSPVCAFSWADDSGYWFDLMGQYHGMGPFLCFVSLLTIVLYFVTSSDSGSLIVDLIANNGRESHWVQRVFWALTEGAVAMALLRAGGQESLKALQSVSICAGLPFTVILMLMCSALWRALKIDQQHMPARDQRVDWALPLYGGIFDLLEFVLSLGKSGLPQSSAVRDFFLGLFAPPLLLWKALRGLAALQAQQPKGSSEDSQPSTVLQDGFLVAACSLTFSSWIILHILTGAKVEGASGLWGIAWTAFVGFAVLVASVRHVVRAHFKIEGSGCEDFFAALLFWPQTLAQMVQQVSQEHSSKSVTSGEEQLKQVEKEGSSNRGDLRRVVHACWLPKNWGSTIQALPGGISAFPPSVQAAEPNSRRQCNSASRSSFLRDPAMAEVSPDLVLAGEAEYERGYGSGPFGMREVKLSKGFTLNPVVSVFAAAVMWILVIKVSVEKEQSMKDFKEAQSWVTSTFTWFYISSQCYWVLYVVPLVYYYGDVKLGKDDEKPEYSDASYFAMVFCAGVGIGLIFYGASEPLWHMLSGGGSNRYNNNGYFNDNEKAQAAINVTLFHWGIQAWVGYAITAVSMGFLSYRKGLPLTFRITLAPLFGKAIWGWFGDLVDILAIVTIATSCYSYLLNVMVQSLGYHIQNFIEISFVTDAFAQLAKGEGAPNDGLGADPAWMDWWTIFYWGWWISWAPFVGSFLARISRGRTIRNVFFYSLSVPFLYALVWFGTFGGASIRMHRRATFLSDMGLQLHQNADFYLHTSSDFRPAGAGNCYTVPESLNHASYSAAGAYVTDMKVSPVCAFSWADDSGYWFDLMGQYHGMGPFLCFVSLITIVLYFVTSSDSGSLIVDLIANNGRESHWVQRVFWALTEGAVAMALLRAGGQESLKALQSVSICAGLPFTVILMLMCSALWRALKIDQQHMPARDQRVDWALPLYGGIFDLLEFVLSLGKSGLPQSSAVRDFFLGLFAPPLLLWKALRGLAALQAQQPKGSSEDSQPSTVLQDGFLVAACSLTFSSWIILHILTGAKVEGASGLWGIAWTAFVGFAVLVASVRHVVRAHFKIEGSGCEDFFAALLFWLQTLAQMVQQVSQEHSSKSVTSGEEQLKQVEKEGAKMDAKI
ncbi:unnamed protein product [Polarella glacialis]|uniref:Uncharacterized protein n=1 Tax=Polarella glacialis TaxID=89957 RepID=A0A813LQ00_POLGL|nr:unnamed protein product [Polarella glacialis]